MTATESASTKPRARALVPIGVAVVTTLLVTLLSYALPAAYQATAVGLAFLLVTYLLVVREQGDAFTRHGLALGGLLEPEPLSLARLARESALSLARALAVGALIFPVFWLGWVRWWQPEGGFSPAPLGGLARDGLDQLFVIALPEEAFYRGYLQSALDDTFPRRIRLLGAPVGLSLVVTSALFALGHLATELNPNRLAVFFPSLLFGWLRARTRGIGSGVAFHALSNLFTAYLAQSYGFS